jgi:serine/threonine protein kinase
MFTSENNKYEYYISNISLGSGGYGQVWKGIRRQIEEDFNEPVAVKEIILKDKDNNCSEFEVAKTLNHENAVKNYDLIKATPSENKYFIILELCDYDLKNHLKKNLDENEIIDLMKQIYEAVNYLHSQKVFHRDIKPDNILMKKGVLKITDFGTSRILEDNLYANTFKGTPLYAAPEILVGHPANFSADIFSMGVTFFYMLYQKTPWEIFDPKMQKDVSQMGLYNNIKEFHEKNFDFFIDPKIKVPSLVKHMILKCMNLDSTLRPSLEYIKSALYEVFFY